MNIAFFILYHTALVVTHFMSLLVSFFHNRKRIQTCCQVTRAATEVQAATTCKVTFSYHSLDISMDTNGTFKE